MSSDAGVVILGGDVGGAKSAPTSEKTLPVEVAA